MEKVEWRVQNEYSCDEWIFEVKKFKEINCLDIEKVQDNILK